MTYKINERGNLVITATPEERADITPPESDQFLYEDECLEKLIANSELDWIPEGVSTRDLTGAPMLGILGDEGMEDHSFFPENFGFIPTGSDGVARWARPIIARWAYMDYQVRSFVTDLIEKGECEWEGGYADGVIRQTKVSE